MDQMRTNLIERVRAAFADNQYPGDEKLVYDNTGFHADVAESANSFRSQDWKTIPLDVLVSQRDSLSFLTPEAYHYFLPSFIIAILSHDEKLDVLRNNTVYSLYPPSSEEGFRKTFLSTVSNFSKEQKQVITDFLKTYYEMKDYFDPNGELKQAIEFWENEVENS
jgi:hypothetical protein